jgi:hypothetical protein
MGDASLSSTVVESDEVSIGDTLLGLRIDR